LLNDSNKLENILAEVLKVTDNIKKEYNKNVPVIAAGGIYSGDDIYQIIKQGASAVQLGTRFVVTEECDASVEFKNAFVEASDKDIAIIKSPVGMPGRTIFNSFLSETAEGKRKPSFCRYNCIKSCNPKTTSYCISEALFQAYKGNLADGFVFTGVNAGKVTEISTVKKIFVELESEYAKAKDNQNGT
jgi:nitronate monooxygenase